jgi:hypothetical protein
MGYDVGLLGSAFVYHGGMVSRSETKEVPVGMGAKIRGANAGSQAARKLRGITDGNPLPEKVLRATGNMAKRVIQLPGQIFCAP